MDPTTYIFKNRADPAIAALLNGLGAANQDSFGGLLIYDYPTRGVAVYFDASDRVRTVFLYSEGRDGHSQSVLPLPHDLLFSDTPERVNAKVGKPQQSGVVKASGRKWVRYDYGSHALHLEFGVPDERISLARVMVPV